MPKICFLVVYSDIVGSFWAGDFDLNKPAGNLRREVYDHSLQGLLPAGSSSSQLGLYHVEGGIEYDPEETFRQCLSNHLNTHEPRKLGLYMRVGGVVGEVEEGRVYLILGLPDRPLVTVPEQGGAKTVSPSATDSDTDSHSSSRPSDETMPSETDDTHEPKHRRAVTAPDLLPVEIFGPSFAYFIGSLNSAPPVPYDSSFLSLVVAFLERAATVDLTDSSQTKSLTTSFVDLVSPGGEKLRVSHAPTTAYSSIFCIVKDEREAYAPLVVFKAIGDSGPVENPKIDPAMRSAIHTCDNSWPKRDRQRFHRVCAMPVFGITIAGSSLRIYGCAFGSQWACQQLTTSHNIAHVDSTTVESLARTLWILRESIVHLRDWYQVRMASIVSRYHYRLRPRPCTFIDASGAEVEFTYLGPLDHHNNVFLAGAVHPDPRTFIVKFTPTYGADAHRLLAQADLAPNLWYAGSPYTFPGYTRWKMVVMEKCYGGHIIWEVAGEPIRQQVRDAVRLLHENGFVHGDLRSQNIMLEENLRLRVIDFDWADKEGIARYPLDLSPKIPWPAGSGPGALIAKEHDDYWVGHVLATPEYKWNEL